mmetsp:Transcript_24766/g.54080  ORF Transcript_24766/g.54080 Transcript_24766/m.54080 type:complete len:227 (+) Transcript_24766:934-1614(+)
MGRRAQTAHDRRRRLGRRHRRLLPLPHRRGRQQERPLREVSAGRKEEEEALDVAGRVGQVSGVVAVHSEPRGARHCLRHVHQPRRGHLEGQAQGAVPRPVGLLGVHGAVLVGDGRDDAGDDVLRPLRAAQVGVGRRCADHARRPPRHRRRLLRADAVGHGALSTGSPPRHDAAYARCPRRRRAEHRLKGRQVLSLRPLQGDGVHPARPGAEDQGQGRDRRHRGAAR